MANVTDTIEFEAAARVAPSEGARGAGNGLEAWQNVGCRQ